MNPIASSNPNGTEYPLASNSIVLLPIHLKPVSVSQIGDNFKGNTCIVRWDDLTTVTPVNFVPIILSRIMRSCDHDTNFGLEVINRVRNQRSWNKVTVDKGGKIVDFESFKKEGGNSDFSKSLRVQTMVMANDNSWLNIGSVRLRNNVRGQPLRRLHDSDLVKTIETCLHLTTETCCSKGDTMS
ncbi:hypothetical protein WICPIJ_007385 [Wickerhamomyces pijperi]|uniref:Uncharacterized protein n=1 Tax=Wickerhamomyces pijperi TaxID=599730 RepID=A0A9P8Q2P9_WICPI|nr:hypothetical protein WICPIJ_007385 [Wickerhamomyces pijperi]